MSQDSSGGWGGFFDVLIGTGQNAVANWWEDRLDTELGLSEPNLGTTQLAAGGAGVDDIDNAAPHSGIFGGSGSGSMLWLGVGALALVAVVLIANKS